MGHLYETFILLSLCVLVSCKYPHLKSPTQPEPLYRVFLDHCGPGPSLTQPIEKPPIVTEEHHEPLQILPHPPIPAPKVLSHKVYHVQTILRPKVYQRVITVPRMLRFLRKEVKPVIEHVPYMAKPICPPELPPPIIGLNSALKTPQSAVKPAPPCTNSLLPNSPPQYAKTVPLCTNSLLPQSPPQNLDPSLPPGITSWKDLFPTPIFSHNNLIPKIPKKHLTPLSHSLSLPTLL